MTHVLGVDAGNSKTVAFIATLDGTIVGYGRSGCGDISNKEVGSEKAIANIIDAVEQALQSVKGITDLSLKATVFSLAGADWSEDYAYIKTALGPYKWSASCLIVNDAMGALRATSLDGIGVAIVCGTYAVTAARSEQGDSWYSGFWQETGGAYQFSQEILKHVYRADLNLISPTSLTQAVLNYFNEKNVEAVLHNLTARESSIFENNIAKLAPLVFNEAEKGDSCAKKIISEQAKILSDYTLVAAQKVNLATTDFKVYLTGGIFRHKSQYLVTEIKKNLTKTIPSIQVSRSHNEASIGAILYALENANVNLSSKELENLNNSLPEATFFSTLQ